MDALGSTENDSSHGGYTCPLTVPRAQGVLGKYNTIENAWGMVQSVDSNALGGHAHMYVLVCVSEISLRVRRIAVHVISHAIHARSLGVTRSN